MSTLVCSKCGTQDFAVINGAGETRRALLKCNQCQVAVCFRCADRFIDHSGVKMLACPACHTRETLEDLNAANS